MRSPIGASSIWPAADNLRKPAASGVSSIPFSLWQREIAGIPLQSPRRLLLVCIPFQNARLSSLSVAHLATYLRANGADCTEFYSHFKLADLLGEASYREIVDGHNHAIGELLFAEGLNETTGNSPEYEKLEKLFGDGLKRKAILDTFKEYCLERVGRERPDVLGISTSAGQLVPGLWLARAVKTRYPDIVIVLGGSACSDPMGQRIKEFYPFIDCVVGGYGEQPLLTLAQGSPVFKGVLSNTVSLELESLPIPNYQSFLSEAREFGDRRRMMLAFESSRGCWWGQKHHCTFCGLNRLEMAFTQKSTERVVREVRALWETYGYHLFATDTILSRDHLKNALPQLAGYPSKPNIFYEVKANMTEDEVEMLRRSGVRSLQPGIESLSTALLKLIRKGVTGIQNLALLKWCRERQMSLSWNQLCAIPGESLNDYLEQIDLMKKIPHLTPPGGVHPIRIDRYSPYFNDHKGFGWPSIQPLPIYRLLHPHIDDESLKDLAYHFDGIGGVTPKAYFLSLKEAVDTWKARHRRGDGLFMDPEGRLIRMDDANAFQVQGPSLLQEVLKRTHSIVPAPRLMQEAGCSRGFLEQLVDEGILHMEGESVLNLAVRLGIDRKQPASNVPGEP